MKPYDGGAWVGVTHVKTPEDLRRAYAESGTRIMHLQKAVSDYDLFVRTVGIGPQVRLMRYDPTAPLHARYVVDFMFVDGEEYRHLIDQMLTINAFFGWEHNSSLTCDCCELSSDECCEAAADCCASPVPVLAFAAR